MHPRSVVTVPRSIVPLALGAASVLACARAHGRPEDAALAADAARPVVGTCPAARECFSYPEEPPPFVEESVCIVEPELEVRFVSHDIHLCHCLHGAGPGVDGNLTIDVLNATDDPVPLPRLANFALTDIETGEQIVQPPEVAHSFSGRRYRCAGESLTLPRTAIEAHRSERLSAWVHFDAMSRAGRYRAVATVVIGRTMRTLDLGVLALTTPIGP